MLGLHFTPACVLLLVCSLHFTHSLHFTPGPQSAVRSPQSSFYTDRKLNRALYINKKATSKTTASRQEDRRLLATNSQTLHTYILLDPGADSGGKRKSERAENIFPPV